MTDAPPPPQAEIVQVAEDVLLEEKLSPSTEELVKTCPKLVLGSTNFFSYNEKNHSITITHSFHTLLKFLVRIHELNPEALKATTLTELNSILQQPQGFHGGLLRKEGTERWDLRDSPIKKKFQERLETLFSEIGFRTAHTLSLPQTVDHCVLFGAHTTSMEQRIKDTLYYLENGLQVTNHVYLLGCTRPLIQNELESIREKSSKLSDDQKKYWQTLFDTPANQTEANAFLFLWKYLAPQSIQKKLEDKLIVIESSRLLPACGQGVKRPTTESTAEDWNAYYLEGKEQSIFATVRQPYVRLFDQFRTTVLTKGKKATKEELLARMKNTTFTFVTPDATAFPLISVTLDEIARNVYRITDTLHYLESVQ